MATWSHFLSGEDPVKQNKPETCFRTDRTLPKASSVALVSPGNFIPLTGTAILRTLSEDSSPVMSQNHPSDSSSSSVGCLPVESSPENNYRVPGSNQIPRRNLMEAFEELHIKPSKGTDAPSFKSLNDDVNDPSRKPVISPTGVIELTTDLSQTVDSMSAPSSIVTPEKTDVESPVPQFYLHPELKKDLTDALVNRVSFYAVIHDINKEATAMAANDDSGYTRNPEDMQEEFDPLVVAVNGPPNAPLYKSNSMVKVALIDEEKWLLNAIDARGGEETRSINACPPTFLQAMGERDYENPLASLSNGSRTQLWKPSRSWWEAKSGKNPWIEPKSHNKRWRYLWPLIHYHKFLAKCIKKLKRNGVDVKTSVSPVSVFLREEVCAVSDHLAAVSLFDSEEWMACLENFHGWIDLNERAESRLRSLVSQLQLRPLSEPGDVESPLLRSQIDEQYLRAMVSARAQMAGAVIHENKQSRPSKDNLNRSRTKGRNDSSKKNFEAMQPKIHGQQPPVYPRQNSVSPNTRPPLHTNGPSPGAHNHPWNYPPQPGQWWGNQWNSQGAYFGDDGTIGHSGLSGDNYHQPFDMSHYGGHLQQPQYFPSMMYPQHQVSSGQPQTPYDSVMQNPSLHLYNNNDWAHPQLGRFSELPAMPGTPGAPVVPPDCHTFNSQVVDPNLSPSPQLNVEHTPFKYNSHQVPMSPYWGHLDHATLAMMGIASPQGASSPQTPARLNTATPDEMKSQQQDMSAFSMNAQPLLLRQHCYGYGVPPSPATQFMMSPQSCAYNFGGYGVSPKSYPQHQNVGTDLSDARNDIPESNNEATSVTPIKEVSNKNSTPVDPVSET